MSIRNLSVLALALVASAAPVAASATVGDALLAMHALRNNAVAQGTAHFKIFEIFANPPGSPDETKGQEYIVIKGTPNTSLTGYAIVIVENEDTSPGSGNYPAYDVGSVDNIIPLNGYTTDANGYVVIRDQKGTYGTTNTALGTITGYTAPGSGALASIELSDDTTSLTVGWSFNTTTGAYQATTADPTDPNLTWGGNSLENSGGNYFLVQHANPRISQKVEDNSSGSETRISTGTWLDRDKNGILDYLQTSKPSGWIRPWETVEDAVFLPLKSTGGLPLSSQGNYVGSLTSGSYNTRLVAQQNSNSTADFFARLTNTAGKPDDALVTDVTNTSSSTRFDFDTAEDYFATNDASTYAHTVSSYSTTSPFVTYEKPGNSGYISVTDNNGVVYTH